MIQRRTLLVYHALAISLTFIYCLVAWYLSAVWAHLVQDTDAVSGLSFFFIRPLSGDALLGMLHWQIAALVVLSAAVVWSFRRDRSVQSGDSGAIALILPLAWIVLCLMLHIVGFLASFLPLCCDIP